MYLARLTAAAVLTASLFSFIPIAGADRPSVSADSISISDTGRGDFTYGNFSMNMSTMVPAMSGPNKVFIFRNLPMGDEEAKRLGIRVGAAYLWQPDGTFKFIEDVDLKLSDQELCKKFGVSVANKWHRTYWAAPQ